MIVPDWAKTETAYNYLHKIAPASNSTLTAKLALLIGLLITEGAEFRVLERSSLFLIVSLQRVTGNNPKSP